MQLHSIVFDLDGTLIDSIPDVLAAVNRALADWNRRPLTRPELESLLGPGAESMIQGAFELTGKPESLAERNRCIARYLEHYMADPTGHTIVFDGVRRLLDEAKSAGLPMGICTNKPSMTTLPVLDGLGLTDYFRAVVPGDSLPQRKPDGRHVLTTLERMGVPAAGSVFVGDSIADVSAARDAGLPVIAVKFGYAVNDLKADAFLAHFDDFWSVVEAL